MGFIIHFYITFGTNLLTGAQPILQFYCLFQYFKEKEYQMESKRNETFGSMIFWKNMILETWSSHQKIPEESRRLEGAPRTYWARPPVSWAPRAPTDRLLSPI